VRRFGREAEIGELLDPPHWLPAAGQGALAIVCRSDDQDTLDRIAPLNDGATRAATTAERAFLARLEGGCQIPIGALARTDGESLHLRGLVASLDGTTIVRGEIDGSTDDAAATGERLAAALIGRGADAVLAEVRSASPRDVPPPAAP
jgi:hydroxymethylbilane synthase